MRLAANVPDYQSISPQLTNFLAPGQFAKHRAATYDAARWPPATKNWILCEAVPARMVVRHDVNTRSAPKTVVHGLGRCTSLEKEVEN